MIKKIKNLRKEVVRKIAQLYADVLFSRLQMLVDLEDDSSFDRLYEVACYLNSYCIVFYDIYLD